MFIVVPVEIWNRLEAFLKVARATARPALTPQSPERLKAQLMCPRNASSVQVFALW